MELESIRTNLLNFQHHFIGFHSIKVVLFFSN
uniref:Uncharacterized protein n=1 Tax=Arundo donax TaxID=35708 RepID=A0A0A8YVD2_ARUDO